MKSIMKKEKEMVNIITLFENNQSKYKITEKEIEIVKKSIFETLNYESFSGVAEVNITFTDNEQIKVLNNNFRSVNKETDVLSFPLGENGVYDINYSNGAKQLGDIVISVEKAINQSVEYGHSFERELSFLTVHSTLHLLGYDHVNSKEEENLMFGKQDEIMKVLKISR